MTIKDLGRWESLEMVQRYTRSVTFHYGIELYKIPTSLKQTCRLLPNCSWGYL